MVPYSEVRQDKYSSDLSLYLRQTSENLVKHAIFLKLLLQKKKPKSDKPTAQEKTENEQSKQAHTFEYSILIANLQMLHKFDTDVWLTR